MLTNNVKTARASLLMLVALTVVNCALAFTESGYYFLFSATIPYFVLLFFTVLGSFAEMPFFFIFATVFALVFLGGLVALAIYAKKYKWCLLVAGIVMVLDTLALIALTLTQYELGGIIDILFHAWILFDLFRAYFEKPPVDEVMAVVEADSDAE